MKKLKNIKPKQQQQERKQRNLTCNINKYTYWMNRLNLGQVNLNINQKEPSGGVLFKRCSAKTVFLKVAPYLQEDTCDRVS